MDLEKYQPSNGTEGMCFIDEWCAQCVRDSEENPCEILTMTMIHSVDDDEYPAEWVYSETGTPCCTAFTTDPSDDKREVLKLREDQGQLRLFSR